MGLGLGRKRWFDEGDEAKSKKGEMMSAILEERMMHGNGAVSGIIHARRSGEDLALGRVPDSATNRDVNREVVAASTSCADTSGNEFLSPPVMMWTALNVNNPPLENWHN